MNPARPAGPDPPHVLHRPGARKTLAWAGGTSTELFIHPADGSFTGRRFQFRISCATADGPESSFTALAGVTRHLMVLAGELEIVHAGQAPRRLEPFAQHTFPGDWATRSRGRAVDLNLMLKDGWRGSLRHVRLHAGAPTHFRRPGGSCFVYVANGMVRFQGGDAAAGDLLEVREPGLRLEGDADVVEIRVEGP